MASQDPTTSIVSVDSPMYLDRKESSVLTSSATTKGKKRSLVWEDYDEVVLSDGSKRVVCKRCKISFKPNVGGATSHLWRHRDACPKKSRIGRGHQVLSFSQSEASDNTAIRGTCRFEKEMIKNWVAKLVILEEKPFRFVESKIFTAYSKFLNPRYEKVSRGVVRRECMKIYSEEKSKIKSKLAMVGHISLTSDLWTCTDQKIGYISLTCHYLDADWQLHKVILNFRHISTPHSGVAIADTIYQCLIEWGIIHKIISITLDNAVINDNVISILKDNFAENDKLYFGGKIFEVRCCTHIINLIVQDGFKLIETTIENIRESINYIRVSPSRLHTFTEAVKHLELPAKKSLKLDVYTSWNSTYEMLDSAMELKQAFYHYADLDSNYHWLPTQEDWSKAEEIHQFLKIFYTSTKLFSENKYPTANLFFPELWKIKDTLIKKSINGPSYLRDVALGMKVKFEKYWSECHLLLAIAAVLDPRYKMSLIKFSFSKIYSTERAEREVKRVLEAINELYSFYAGVRANMEESVCDNSQVGQDICSSSAMGSTDYDSEFENYIKIEKIVQSPKSDLDVYFEDALVRGQSSDFDVLGWWKFTDNAIKYKTLSMMAHDILSIPISTRAPEFTFSTECRAINNYHSSLSPKTNEALICTKDWLRPLWDEGPPHTLYNDVLEDESESEGDNE